MLEAKDAHAPRSEARFANPYVLLPVYPAVLWVLPFEVFVQLVRLVHNVKVWDLPTPEVHQFVDDLPAMRCLL